jgi:hypothetical protein
MKRLEDLAERKRDAKKVKVDKRGRAKGEWYTIQ